MSAAAGTAAWTGAIKIVGTATIQGQKSDATSASASIVWPVQPEQNIPTISRVDRSLMLAVRPGAPYSLAASLDKPALVQGEKGTLKVKLTRLSPDFKTPLTVQAIAHRIAAGTDASTTISRSPSPPRHTDGTLPINVPANVQPGTYTHRPAHRRRRCPTTRIRWPSRNRTPRRVAVRCR